MAFDTVLINDFSGGLDLVSSLETIPPGFTPNAKNFRISEYGGIEKVAGYSAFATVPNSTTHDLYYFEKRDGSTKLLISADATTWQKIDSGGTVTAIRSAMTTNTETTFVQYEDSLYGLDRANNLGKWDGTTLTTYAPGVDTGPKLGIILGVWQNRLWVSPATGMRVEFSAPATLTGTGSWPLNNYVELGGPGTTDRIVGGVPTPDGLLVFTTHSTYLIYDDTTGANRLVDADRGCSSRKSLARVGDTIYGMCSDGVFATRGSTLSIVSNRVSSIFRNDNPTLTNAAGVAYYDSYIGTMQLVAAANDVSLELYTRSGAFMAFDYPAYCWAHGPLSGAADQAFFIDATDRTKIRKAFSGGSFAGSDISCVYETPLNPLGDETDLKRARRVRVVGRGALTVALRVDSSLTDAATALLAFPTASGGLWGTMTWGSGTWGGYQLFEGWANVASRGRRFTVRLTETSQSTTSLRPIFDQTVSGSLGGAGVYLIEAHFSRTSKRRQL